MSIQKLQDIFRATFENPRLKLSPGLSAKDVKNWDSVSHINLIVALEESFGVTFTTKEMGGMRTVDDLLKLLNKKGQKIAWPKK